MSLPSPSTTPQSHSINPNDFIEFEQPLMELARRSNGDLRRLLTAFFGFLHRRTDFYVVSTEGSQGQMGFPMGDAEKLLLASFRQFPLRKVGTATVPPPPSSSSSSPHDPEPANKDSSSTLHASSDATSTTTPTKVSSTKENISSTTPGQGPTKTTASEITRNDVVTNKTNASNGVTAAAATTATTSTIRWTEEGLQIPVGNGGTTDRYQWTQTLEEVTVIVPVDRSLHGKDIRVTVLPQTLSVTTKAPQSGELVPTEYVSGTLSASIDPNESTWTLEGGVVQVILFKSVPTFWSNVLTGDAEIDTDLVDNRRDIRSYDDATQAKLRQVMFDQAQMAKGLPTSDQMQNKIPPLPPGVEYINQEVLDKHNKVAEKVVAGATDDGKV